MANNKTAVPAEYTTQLNTFIALLGTDRNPHVVTGRAYDKVCFVTPDGSKVHYFVSRRDISTQDIKMGDIFGRKTDQYPQLNWFFGNIADAEKWDWSGVYGVPVSDDSVHVVKKYGNHIHYRRKK